MERPLSGVFERWRARRDPRDLAEVFDRISPELLRVAIHLVGEPATAEDLVQATFLTAIERASTFDASRRLEPWLAGILENHSRELLRISARVPDPERLEQRLQESPLDAALARELSAEIATALDGLPEPYRRTLLLRVRHGLAPADIAHVLGENPGAVRVRLHRALEMVRKRLPESISLGSSFSIEPARGMASVKAVVLSAGGGMFLVKKFVAATALLVLFLLAWWNWPTGLRSNAGSPPPTSQAARLEEPPRLPLVAPPTEVSARRPDSSAALAVRFPFRGEVVDGESGTPIAGAQVELFAARSLDLTQLRRRYATRLERDWNPDHQPPSGWPFVCEPVDPAQSSGRTPIRVCLAPEQGEAPVAVATSNANGLFELEHDDPQGFLVCRAPGYALREIPMRRRIDRSYSKDGEIHEEYFEPQSLLVRMFAEYEIHGHLIDEEGERVRERVALRFDGGIDGVPLREPPVDDPDRGLGSWMVTTDAEGAFRAHVATSHVQVTCIDPRWSLCTEGVHPERRDRWAFATSVGREQSIEDFLVVVRRTPVLRVRDRATRAPIEDLFVSVRAPQGAPIFAGRYFAPGGELRLLQEHALENRGVVHGQGQSLEFTVWSEGYAASVLPAILDPRGKDLDVDLARGDVSRLEGRIVRGDAPISGVDIAVTPASESGLSAGAFGLLDAAKSDALGCFAFDLPAGFYALHITIDGFERTRGVSLPAAEPCVFDLRREGSILVQMRGLDGLALVGGGVALQSTRAASQYARSDEQGELRFVGLEPGTYRLLAMFEPGKRTGRADATKEIELAPGREEHVEFHARSGSGRFARLEVRGEGDLAAWRARARASDRDWKSVERSGRIPIELGPDVRQLEFDRGGGTRWILSIPKDPPQDLVLRIDPSGIGYDVELAWAKDGQPLAGVEVVAWSRTGTPMVTCRATSDPSGVVRLRGLVPGAFTLSLIDGKATAFEQNGSTGAIDVEPRTGPSDPPARLHFDVPTHFGISFPDFPDVRVTGVLRARGAPVAGASIRVAAVLSQTDGVLHLRGERFQFRTGADGKYALDVPSTGMAQFMIRMPEGRVERLEWYPEAQRRDLTHDLDIP